MAKKTTQLISALCFVVIAFGCVERTVEEKRPAVSQNPDDYVFSPSNLTGDERNALKSAESGSDWMPAVVYRRESRPRTTVGMPLPMIEPVQQADQQYAEPGVSEGRPLSILPADETLDSTETAPKTNYVVPRLPGGVAKPSQTRSSRPPKAPAIKRPKPPDPGGRYAPKPTATPIVTTGREAHGPPLKGLDTLSSETSYLPALPSKKSRR